MQYVFYSYMNSLHANSHYIHRLMTYANSFDPDQAPHYVGPDLDPNYLHPRKFRAVSEKLYVIYLQAI